MMPLLNIDAFLDYLKQVPLGGKNTQFKLAPKHRVEHDFAEVMQRSPRLAAVAVILYQQNNKLYMVLTKRADYTGHHAGQISFPGGKLSNSDDSLLEAAIRETREEIGVMLNRNQYIKSLTNLYIPVSHFLVFPYVFYISEKPSFRVNYEVEELITPNWFDFIDDKYLVKRRSLVVDKVKVVTSGFEWHNHFIWGATAMMLSELKELTRLYE